MARSAATSSDRRTAPARPSRALRGSRAALERIFGPPSGRSFRTAYWDGTTDEPGNGASPDFTLRLTWPGALRRAFLPPTDLSVGEALVRGDLEVEGDLEAAIRAGAAGLRGLKGSPRALVPLVADLARLPARPSGDEPSAEADGTYVRARFHSRLPSHTRRRDSLAVRFHYDLGNDFYRLFLDRRMQYSSAYFADPAMELEEAQEAKLDLICRKLRLQRDERFLDVGCGWGGLLVHAAERYGVRAMGITLSPVQAAWAREVAARAGLGDRCRIEVMDYRELPVGARFDKIASVGMIEHVGLGRYPRYFGGLFRLLRPGGLLMNQGIVALTGGHTRLDRLRLKIGRRWGSFIHRHIFPDSDLVPLGRTLAAAEAVGFETRSVESLRKHYARTLRCWVGRLEDHWDQAVAAAGVATCRAWRFYMAASAHLFSAGEIGVVQCLLARPGTGGPERSF
jgi:cyclopropane-fatty-acyl-phospholipid synthase